MNPPSETNAPDTIPASAPPRPRHVYDSRDLHLVLDSSEVGHFHPYDRQQILALKRRVNWLNDRIHNAALDGKPIQFLRVERKALRWALEQLGLTLPPNPPIPNTCAPAMVSVTTVTNPEGSDA